MSIHVGGARAREYPVTLMCAKISLFCFNIVVFRNLVVLTNKINTLCYIQLLVILQITKA